MRKHIDEQTDASYTAVMATAGSMQVAQESAQMQSPLHTPR
jgi:hypothetical protein